MKNKAIKVMGLTTAILTTVGTTTVLAEEVETVEVVTEKATTNETVIESAREKVSEKQEEVDVQTIVANQTTKETERIGVEKENKEKEVTDNKVELVNKETTVTEKEEKVAELEALKDNATIEKPKVEKGIADTNQEISTKENDVDGKVVEVDGIKQQVTAQEGVVASETSKLDAITEEKEKLVNANIELSNALNQQDNANKEVETQTSNVAGAEQTKSELEQEKTAILEANADKQADIERLESEISELNTQVEEKQPQVDTTKTELDAVIRQLAEMNIPTLQFTERFMELQTTLASDKSLEAERIAEGQKSFEMNWGIRNEILSKFDNTTRYNPLDLPLEIRYKMAFLVQDLVKGYQETWKEKLIALGYEKYRDSGDSWKFTEEVMTAAKAVADYSTADTAYDFWTDGHNDNALRNVSASVERYITGENLGSAWYNEESMAKGGYTERDIVRDVISNVMMMLFKDSDSKWAHAQIATTPFNKKDSALGFAISKNNSQAGTLLLYHFINTMSREMLEDGYNLSYTEVKKPTTEALEAKKTNLQSTYNTLSSELTEIKNNLETKTTELSTLTDGIIGLEDVNARIERNETTLANFRQALATAQSNKAVAEREVAVLNDLKGQLVIKEQELSTLRNELSELETKVLTLTERLNTLNNIDDLLSEAKSELALAVSERCIKTNYCYIRVRISRLSNKL